MAPLPLTLYDWLKNTPVQSLARMVSLLLLISCIFFGLFGAFAILITQRLVSLASYSQARSADVAV